MTPRLEYAAAIELTAAVVADRARRAGLRVLFVKGPFFTELGVRRPKTSLDLDIILHPADVPPMVDLLARDGWRMRDDPEAVLPFEEHSVTILHHFWPCSIDVHRFWLGLLGDPGEVFDLMWSRRTSVLLQSGRFETPRWEDAAILQALNEIRGGQRRVAGVVDVTDQAGARLAEDAGPVLRRHARELYAELSAAPFLEQLGEDVVVPESAPPEYREWQRRLYAEDHSTTGWVLRMRDEPPWRWPGHLLAALALRPSQLRALRPDARPGFRGYVLAWADRARKGGRDLAHAVGALRRSTFSGADPDGRRRGGRGRRG